MTVLIGAIIAFCIKLQQITPCKRVVSTKFSMFVVGNLVLKVISKETVVLYVSGQV